MSSDDYDELDPLLEDERRVEIEARFQELEHEAEIERMRREAGARPSSGPSPDAAPSEGPRGSAEAKDPLASMKAAVDADGELERHLLVLCPHCGAKNRMSLSRVRTQNPICGRCKQDLATVTF